MSRWPRAEGPGTRHSGQAWVSHLLVVPGVPLLRPFTRCAQRPPAADAQLIFRLVAVPRRGHYHAVYEG
jgi:hypothetical protein